MEPQDIIAAIERLARMPAGTLKSSQPLSGLLSWDSLAMIEFIATIDDNTGYSLEPESVRRCRTVQELVDLTSTQAVSR